MARPQMDRVDGQSPTSPQSCRMEVLRPNGGTQSRHRHRPNTLAPLVISTHDSVSTPSSPQQDSPLRESTGLEQDRLCPTENQQQPLSDRLPGSSSSSSNSSRRGSIAEEEPMDEEQIVGRVAIQLRTIGDEMNTVFLERRNEVAQWQNWRGLYRGLVAFLADTISTLYQHGLR